MSIVVPYQSRHVSHHAAEFDFHFEQEMARRLRRRFLWYCAVTVVLSLLVLIPGLVTGRPAVQVGPGPAPAGADRFGHLTSVIGLLLYIAAFALAWFKRMRREHLLRLAMWLYVLATIPSLIGTRLMLQVMMPLMADEALVQRERDRERRQALEAAGLGRPAPPQRPDELAPPASAGGIPMTPPVPEVRAATQPATRAATRPAGASAVMVRQMLAPAMAFLYAVPFMVLMHHTFVCLFLPWTLKQSLGPAAVLMAVITAVVMLDVLGGAMPWSWKPAAILLPVTALMFVPGSAFCWWRFSRMRRDILLNFESQRLHALQFELNSARRILESALPAPRTVGPVQVSYVYEPMRQIGGDLLFMHPPAGVESDLVTIVLLDVTGHGIAAALAVNRLVGELERLFAEAPHSTPADVLCALNRYVHFTMARHDMYVTAIAVQADVKSRKFTYASAGHPTAFLRRADGTMIDLESTAMLLGIVDGAVFTADPVEHELHAGDAIIAYTDGASEAANVESMVMLGIDGVRTTVQEVAALEKSPVSWPDEVMRKVVAFRASPPADDTLLVTISWNGDAQARSRGGA